MATLNTSLGQIRIIDQDITYIKITKNQFSVDDLHHQTELLQQHFGLQKHWLLMNFNHIRITSHKEIRNYITSFHEPNLINAVAWLVNNPINQLLGSFIQSTAHSSYPFRVFLSEKKALKWLHESKVLQTS